MNDSIIKQLNNGEIKEYKVCDDKIVVTMRKDKKKYTYDNTEENVKTIEEYIATQAKKASDESNAQCDECLRTLGTAIIPLIGMFVLSGVLGKVCLGITSFIALKSLFHCTKGIFNDCKKKRIKKAMKNNKGEETKEIKDGQDKTNEAVKTQPKKRSRYKSEFMRRREANIDMLLEAGLAAIERDAELAKQAEAAKKGAEKKEGAEQKTPTTQEPAPKQAKPVNAEKVDLSKLSLEELEALREAALKAKGIDPSAPTTKGEIVQYKKKPGQK